MILKLCCHTLTRSVRIVALCSLSVSHLMKFWVWTSKMQLRETLLRRVIKMRWLVNCLLIIIEGVLPAQCCNCSCDDVIGLVLLHLLWKIELSSEAFLILNHAAVISWCRIDSDVRIKASSLLSDLLSVKAVRRDGLRHLAVRITFHRTLDTIHIQVFVGGLTVTFELGSVAVWKVLDTSRCCCLGLWLGREDSIS